MGRRLARQVAQQWIGVALGLVALVVALGGTVIAHGGDGARVHACVEDGNTSRANTMIVGPDAACPAGWTARDWSIQGPPGEKGDPGPRGDAGAQGPQGPAAALSTPESDPSFGELKSRGPSVVARLRPPGSKTYTKTSAKDIIDYKHVTALCPATRPDLVSGGYDLVGIGAADVKLGENQSGLFGWGPPFQEGWSTSALRKHGPGLAAPGTPWALKVTVVCKKRVKRTTKPAGT